MTTASSTAPPPHASTRTWVSYWLTSAASRCNRGPYEQTRGNQGSGHWRLQRSGSHRSLGGRRRHHQARAKPDNGRVGQGGDGNSGVGRRRGEVGEGGGGRQGRRKMGRASCRGRMCEQV